MGGGSSEKDGNNNSKWSDSRLEDFRLMSKLGEGTFSVVLKVKHKKNSTVFAMKRFRKTFQSSDEVESLREIQALRRLNPHPHIIDLIDIIFEPKHGILSLNFELMDCNLYELISRKSPQVSEERAKIYFWQICKALEYIHSKGIFHRDIKPENILVRDGHVKIADFGSCRGIHSKQPFTEYIATRWYRSPECLLCDGMYNYKMDMWGAGCVLFEIVARAPLFPGADELDQLHRIHAILGTPSQKLLRHMLGHRVASLKYNFPPKEGTGIRNMIPFVSDECISLISALLAYDPDDRYSSKDALRHSFMNNVQLPDSIPKERRLTPSSKRNHAGASNSSSDTTTVQQKQQPPNPYIKSHSQVSTKADEKENQNNAGHLHKLESTKSFKKENNTKTSNTDEQQQEQQQQVNTFSETNQNINEKVVPEDQRQYPQVKKHDVQEQQLKIESDKKSDNNNNNNNSTSQADQSNHHHHHHHGHQHRSHHSNNNQPPEASKYVSGGGHLPEISSNMMVKQPYKQQQQQQQQPSNSHHSSNHHHQHHHHHQQQQQHHHHHHHSKNSKNYAMNDSVKLPQLMNTNSKSISSNKIKQQQQHSGDQQYHLKENNNNTSSNNGIIPHRRVRRHHEQSPRRRDLLPNDTWNGAFGVVGKGAGGPKFPSINTNQHIQVDQIPNKSIVSKHHLQQQQQQQQNQGQGVYYGYSTRHGGGGGGGGRHHHHHHGHHNHRHQSHNNHHYSDTATINTVTNNNNHNTHHHHHATTTATTTTLPFIDKRDKVQQQVVVGGVDKSQIRDDDGGGGGGLLLLGDKKVQGGGGVGLLPSISSTSSKKV